MWLVELSFTDDSERLAARPAHREKLAALHEQGVVRIAGPFADDSGACLVFDVADKDDLDQLLRDDPCFSTKGVAIAKIREWRPFLG